MAFKYQRDKPLPKGLVHGITSIVFESAMVPAEPPELPQSSASLETPNRKEVQYEEQDKHPQP